MFFCPLHSHLATHYSEIGKTLACHYCSPISPKNVIRKNRKINVSTASITAITINRLKLIQL